MEGKLESLDSKIEILPRVYMQGNQLCYVFGTLKNPIGITVVQTFCEKKQEKHKKKTRRKIGHSPSLESCQTLQL